MNTTPSQRLGFLHHIRLVPLFACILGGILVLFSAGNADLSSRTEEQAAAIEQTAASME